MQQEPLCYIQMDFRGAFNSMERDVMLRDLSGKKKKIPSLFSNVTANHRYHRQQGDPTCPLLFYLTIHSMIEKLKS